jgi:predicted Ser/Thr protein kinase
MENINECLEQRIEQLKCQRDLSIKLLKAGWENDLKSEQMIAVATSQKLINLLNNTELSWDDKLVIRMRELDDAMK